MSTKTGQNSATIRPTIEMLATLAGFITGVLAKLSLEQVQYLLANKNTVLRKKLQEVFEIPMETYADIWEEWQKFYQDHFSLTADFSLVEIPSKPEGGSWRLIFIPAGLTMNSVLAVMRSKFKVWTYVEDLDVSVTTNTRTTAKSYAIWVRDGIEPDHTFLGKSTRDADMNGKIGITLLERLVLEVKFFVETGNHFDINGVTFCTGSRDSDGGVPSVYFNPDGAQVWLIWYRVDNSNPRSGLRQAVSL